MTEVSYILLYAGSVTLFFLAGYLIRPLVDRWLDGYLTKKRIDKIVRT